MPSLDPIYLCGPTASGKTGLAIALAKKWNGEIVNADAYQLYRGLETLAASPTAAEQREVPHHLFSQLDLSASLDAHRYREMARPVIAAIQERGSIPLVVGGSGLYLKFLTHGPSPVPPGDPALRQTLDQRPLEDLLRELTELDPAEAASINRQNRRYVTRSLELCLLTGKPVSQLRRDWKQPPPPGLRGIYLDWPREELAQRIAQRSELMLAGGAIEEVAALPSNATTSSKAIGVKEIKDYLHGKNSLAETGERITIATRQYAKRQRTWFRKEGWLTPCQRNELSQQTEAALFGFDFQEPK
ncbi:tRNA (adenosine(37)-N6)-dimethylallyltransferase MiaA [Roseibacillus ishigakijimensis]|uniref:tRNA dimethylallyltransferase n=1 Tax=Roseibacillus ishigakijimensis TaxID=454146 RepID=A0A934VKZ1_9BACT|nr:tRNA (adenosine(37)-N6)-dimethylallyltransferase MiaA [Roseibacillus ishigakijimensis]MBK1832682.1 tRNA (adenosine(37)-N6)-dimethylallyltransferase MiaA [Roseibacillus ishigakijimensis]